MFEIDYVLDIDYIAKVAANVAIRYFKELLRGVSVWGQILDKDNFDPEFDTINISIVLSEVPVDLYVLLSNIEFDYQHILKLRINVNIFDEIEFEEKYRKGFPLNVLPVIKGHYAHGEDFFKKLKDQKYTCTKDAIDSTLEQAFVSFGLGLNDVLRKDIDIALEEFYNSAILASIAIIQRIDNMIPATFLEIRSYFEKGQYEVAIMKLYSQVVDNIRMGRRDISTRYKFIRDTKMSPGEILKHVLMDDYLHEIIVSTYSLLRESWRIIKRKNISSLDKLMKIIFEKIKDEFIASIEITGKGMYPVLRIRLYGDIWSCELN
ncbi:MAG: hypothetical protein Q6363_006435 [Candidatus Njordarchaeota archaeon]